MIDPTLAGVVVTALSLISGPLIRWAIGRVAIPRQKTFRQRCNRQWNEKLKQINASMGDGGLTEWVSETRKNQEADADDSLVAQALVWSLDIGTRQIDLYMELTNRAQALRRENTALVYSVTAAAAALLVFSLAQVAEHRQPSAWLTWGIAHLGVAVISTFVARLLTGSLAAGSFIDMAAVVTATNWKDRAWCIYALEKGGREFLKPQAILAELLFYWGVFFLVSGAGLIVVHNFEAVR